MSLQKSEFDLIKRAIEVEVNHQYVDLQGKKSCFSEYILGLAKKFHKIPPKDKRWGDIAARFTVYPRMSIADRINSIQSLELLLNEKKMSLSLKPKKISESSEDESKDSSAYSKAPEDVDVQFVKGVGPVLANKLNALHIFTVYDLLTYYPRDHIDFKTQVKIADLEIGEDVTIFGKIKKVSAFNSKTNSKLSVTTIHVYDGTGIVTASWFYSRANRYLLEKYREQFPIGAQVLISGRVKFDKYSGKKAIDKPNVQIVYESEEEIDSLHAGRIVPVYRLKEGISLKLLRRAIKNAIDIYLPYITDPLPESILKRHNLIDKQSAIKLIHFPDEFDQINEARRRLIFEEFFIHQLYLASVRKDIKSNNKSISFEIKSNGLVDKFKNQLPFILTNAQLAAFAEIMDDLQSPKPMHRLLQGDVGCGKTVVACMALLSAIENGFQTAIMAPTEVLAEQHYRKFVEWLSPLGVRIGLFLGKHTLKQKKEMKQNLENGLINIAVGTHALIQEKIVFNNLGLVVIDEQHRFGVMQRTKLKNKGENPELLTMTATPIPRTLALTVHGDLDISTIDEMPPGRKPVRTRVLTPRDRIQAYRLIEEEIKNGRQAYIVLPLIEESEKLPVKAATVEAEYLQNTVFKNYRVGLVHGKLNSVDKDKVMDDFRLGKYDVLVATTVIEVGVDVANATIMMIENADRFGLAQLHQLRGRVGRSNFQSYCYLVTNSNSQEARNRLAIMESTNNGFVIADYDLQIRGPGDFMGTKQSGVPDFILANLSEHADILEIARDAAINMVETDVKSSKQLVDSLLSVNSMSFEVMGSG